jgi:hypothetical protein
MSHVSERSHSVISNSVNQELHYISFEIHNPAIADNVAYVLNFLTFRAHAK